MQVKELMVRHIVAVSPEDSAASAAHLLHRYNIGSLPVMSADGRLRGIVTDRDIVTRCVAEEELPDTCRVRDIMTRSIVTVDEDADVQEAARRMRDGRVRRLPVLRGDLLVGMLSLGDLSRSHACDAEVSRALSEISRRG
ncbi:MAG: CBS domain-containing protein [Clostridia bacterium]|nr:CBS domain-containing protein [Clostridia bacterium]